MAAEGTATISVCQGGAEAMENKFLHCPFPSIPVRFFFSAIRFELSPIPFFLHSLPFYLRAVSISRKSNCVKILVIGFYVFRNSLSLAHLNSCDFFQLLTSARDNKQSIQAVSAFVVAFHPASCLFSTSMGNSNSLTLLITCLSITERRKPANEFG